MPVPLDGVIFAILFWIISSITAWWLLCRSRKHGSLFFTTLIYVVVLGFVSFGLFYTYEWLAGRT